MADINLTRGAELAAKIKAAGGDWRAIDKLLNDDLRADGLVAEDKTGYYKGDVEYGADQADLQASEAGRTDEDGSTRLRRRQQTQIDDAAYESNLQDRVRSDIEGVKSAANEGIRRQRAVRAGSPGQFAARVSEAAAQERFRRGERTAPAGRAPMSERQLFEAVQDKLASGELQGNDAIEAEKLLRSMSERVNPRAALLQERKRGRDAVIRSRQPRTAEETQAIANRLLSETFDRPTSGIGAPDAQYPQGRPYRVVPVTRGAAAPINANQQALAAVQPRGFNSDVRLIHDLQNAARESLPNLNLDRIGEVVIGEVPGGYKDYIREVPTFAPEDDPRNFTYAGQQQGTYVGQTGDPLAIQGPQMPAANVNANGTANALNAPQGGSSLLDVMERNQFSARESGTYPQVDISGELAEFDRRLAGQGIVIPGGVRSMEQAEDAVAQVLAKGGKFNAPGQKVIVDNPGAAEALEKMRYTQPEVSRISNALIQLELGNRQNVNLDRKSAFGSGLAAYPYELAGPTADPAGPLLIGPQQLSLAQRNAEGVSNGRSDGGVVRPAFGSSEAMGDFNAGPELVSANSRVKPRFAALTGENIEGTPQERASALADAQRPYTGQIKGEEPVGIGGRRSEPNLRYNRTGERDMGAIRTKLTQMAMDRAAKTKKRVNIGKLEQNIVNAQTVQQRADDFEAAGPSARLESPINQEYQKRRAVARHLERKPEYVANRVDNLGGRGASSQYPATVERATEGLTADELGQRVLGGGTVGAPRSTVRYAVTERAAPRTPKGFTDTDTSIRSTLGVTQIRDAEAMRPKPQGRNEERAPRMSNAMLGELAELNSAGKPEQGPTRPVTGDLKAALDALGSGRGGGPNNPGGAYMTAPDGPSNNRGYMTAPEGPGLGRRARAVRRGAGYAAAGAVGLAGIGKAISNERQKREEEALV